MTPIEKSRVETRQEESGAFAGLASPAFWRPPAGATCGSPAAPAPFAELSPPPSLSPGRLQKAASPGRWSCLALLDRPKSQQEPGHAWPAGKQPSDRPAARTKLRSGPFCSAPSRVFYAERVNEFPPPAAAFSSWEAHLDQSGLLGQAGIPLLLFFFFFSLSLN